MKIIAPRENFLKALSLCVQTINQRPSIPVLSNFFLQAKTGELTVTATNLDTTIVNKIPAKVEVEGEATTPARLLLEFCQAAKEESVGLELSKDTIKASCGSAKAEMMTISASEFPTISPLETDKQKTVIKKEFLGAVQAVVFCASPEEGRPVLTGVLFKESSNKLIVVATDGYRLGKKETKGTGEDWQALIPAKALNEAVKAFNETEEEELSLITDLAKNQIQISSRKLSVTSRLLEGSYPDYETILPKTFIAAVKAKRSELIDAVKLTSLLARDIGNVVKLKIEKNALKLSASTAQVGQSETSLDASGSGEELSIAFNSRFLLDALNALKGEECELKFSGATSAAQITGPDKELFYVVMPVRVQN